MTTPTDPEVTAELQRLDRALEHPRVLAAKAVAEFRGRSEVTPWINRTTGSGMPLLDVDAVVRAAQPNHAPNVSTIRRQGLLRRLLKRR